MRKMGGMQLVKRNIKNSGWTECKEEAWATKGQHNTYYLL
jgi:hypothetical protein